MADEPVDGEAERIRDLGELAAKVDRIEQVVSKFLGGAHKDATATTEQRLDAPGSMADEVQRELARRDEAAKRDERDALVGKHEETLKALTEKVPEPPPRRVERIMGWNR
jgi:hypothetical protein